MTRNQKKALVWLLPGAMIGALGAAWSIRDGFYVWGLIDGVRSSLGNEVIQQQMLGVWIMLLLVPPLLCVAAVAFGLAVNYHWQGRKSGPGRGYVDVILREAIKDSREDLGRLLSRRSAQRLEKELEQSTAPASSPRKLQRL